MLLSLLSLLTALAGEPSLAIENVAVIDVEAGKARADQTVIIAGDRIQWLGPAAEADVAADSERLDGRGKTLIPGLWDAHVHINQNTDRDIALRMFLAHGVTGVREMGSGCFEPDPERPCLPGLVEWRAAIERGELAGPRLMGLSSAVLGSDAQVASGVERFVERAREDGADFIKIMQGLSAGTYYELMSAAHDAGLPVVGHIPLAVGMADASFAGQASIEHARDVLFDGFAGRAEWRRSTQTQNPPTSVLRAMVDGHDSDLVRELGAVLAENGTHYVPTHLTRRFDAFADNPEYRADPRERYITKRQWDDWEFDAENVLRRDPSAAGRATFMDFYRKGLEATAVLAQAGVTILAGTDAGDSYIFPGSSLHEELGELVEAGLTPAQALRSATWSTALFLGKAQDYGSIAVGKKADLVLLNANPLEDIEHTQAIEAVLFDGRLLSRADLSDLREQAAQAVVAVGPAFELEPAELERFVGQYESQLGALRVERAGAALYVHVPRTARMRLRPTSATDFVILPRSSQVSFELPEEGPAQRLLFRQGNRELEAARSR